MPLTSSNAKHKLNRRDVAGRPISRPRRCIHQDVAIKTNTSLAGAAAVGALAGFIGGAAMLVFGAAFDRVFDRGSPRKGRPRKFLPTADQELDGTAVLALTAGRAVGEDLTGSALINTARAMHFIFSAGLGAVYGAIAEIAPSATLGYGTGFAAVEELSGNEWLMPRVAFLRPVDDYPVHERIHSLTSHLVWGVVTEAVRRRMRRSAERQRIAA